MDNMKRTRDTIPGENSAESCAYWHASCTKAMPHVMLQTQPTISKNVPSCRSAERMLRRQATTGRLILVVVPQQNTLNADNSVPTHAHAHTRTRTHTHTHTHTHRQLSHSVSFVLTWQQCFFERPFVKRFALRYRTVGLSVLSVCLSVCRWRWCTVAKRLQDQHETWHACRPRPRPHYIRWGPSSTSPKGAQLPNFRPISVVAKWLDGLRCHFVRR